MYRGENRFAYPRFAVVPNHEHKAFLPFPTMLPSPHLILSSTTALSISSPQRIVTLLNSSNGEEFELDYEVLVLATGTRLSPPGTIPGKGTKREGVEYLKGLQGELERGEKIVVLGGGAIGVREFNSKTRKTSSFRGPDFDLSSWLGK